MLVHTGITDVVQVYHRCYTVGTPVVHRYFDIGVTTLPHRCVLKYTDVTPVEHRCSSVVTPMW